ITLTVVCQHWVTILPVRHVVNTRRGDRPHVSRVDLADAAEDALRWHNRPKRKRLLESERVEFARDGAVGGEDRLQLTPEKQASAVLAIIQRVHTHSIARQHELL